MKLEMKQDLALGRLTVTMTENCHGDSRPLIDSVHFNRFHEKASTHTGALAAAIISSRWCGNIFEFSGSKLGADVGEAIQLLAPDVRFVQPIDGYRRHLCEGHLDLLVATPGMAGSVLSSECGELSLSRLVTWSGEFVQQSARTSARHIAGEISTNAGILLRDWEVSACIGLLVGGPSLRSIAVPQPVRNHARDFERVAEALWIVGVRLRVGGLAPRLGTLLERIDAADLPVENSSVPKLVSAAA